MTANARADAMPSAGRLIQALEIDGSFCSADIWMVAHSTTRLATAMTHIGILFMVFPPHARTSRHDTRRASAVRFFRLYESKPVRSDYLRRAEHARQSRHVTRIH